MRRAGRSPSPVRVVPGRARRLRQHRLRARLTAALALAASVTLVYGTVESAVPPPGDVVPIALKLETPAASRPAALTPAQVALAEAPGPDWTAEPGGGHARQVVATAEPLTPAEVDRVLRGLRMDRTSKRKLRKLLREIPRAPLVPPS